MAIENNRPEGIEKIDREEVLFRIINSSRNGKFVDPKSLLDNWRHEHDKTDNKADRNIVANIRRDLERRMDLLNQYGEDAISHLEINATTFNLLCRISVVSVEVNTSTISGLTKFVDSKGSIEYKPGEMPIPVSDTQITAWGKVLEEFKKIENRQKLK